ncbi:MAG: Gfo/Idh/MocA family oxidoreductase [Acidimicrobiales bacterium]
MDELKVAVVGAGEMGANHARVLAATKGVQLVGVLDASDARAEAISALHGCDVLRSLDDVLARADAATVAVPSSAHATTATPLLRGGLPCMIEKPFVTSEDEAAMVMAAAEAGSAAVLVGHIERFNPAVGQLRTILSGSHEVLAVDARRMSAVSGRITDVDVVTDLMVHDIDIVLDLVRQPVVDVVARCARGNATSGQDFVTAVLTFAGGAIASLTASRITQNTVRTLQVTTDQRFFTVDYPSQELLIYRQGRLGVVPAETTDEERYVLDVGTERVSVRRVEPLAVELAHFVDVARGLAPPRVSADDALAAMRLVWTIQASLEAGG